MLYFNCSVFPEEVGKSIEDTSEIIVRSDTFQKLIEKMGKIMNLYHTYDRFELYYMASTENGCYILNSWRFNASEFTSLIRRNLNVW